MDEPTYSTCSNIDNIYQLIVMLYQHMVHVHDVVSYALTGFLVSTLFGVSPTNPSNFTLFYSDSLSFSVQKYYFNLYVQCEV